MSDSKSNVRSGRFAGVDSTVALICAIGLCAFLFLVGAGWAVYGNTRSLTNAANWVEHTQEVLTALRRVSLLVERIEYRSSLYLSTKNEEQLARARASENQLETTLVHVKFLVSDNAQQLAALGRLETCTHQLSVSMAGFTLQSPMPADALKECYEATGVMLDQEQWLLDQRSKGSERSNVLFLSSQFAFVGLCLLALVALFIFLVRDALRRSKTEQDIANANTKLAETVRALEDRASETQLMTTARDELQLCQSVDQVYVAAARSLGLLLEGTNGSLSMINNSRHVVEVVSTWQGNDAAGTAIDFHPLDACCGLRSGQSRWRTPGVSEIHCTHFKGDPPERYLCKPISAHGNTLGVLCVVCANDAQEALVNARVDALRQMLQLTGMAVATLNLRMKLENQSIRDHLTGLFNRHFMQISLEREISRASRRRQTLAVFMLDLDHFKVFNDTFGHAAGDAVLKAAAEVFVSSVRAEDVACRYGGEEFTIILPDMSPEIAMQRAESIRRAVERLRVPIGRDQTAEVTVSIGIAMYPADGETGDALLHRADLGLYAAKRQGRNRVIAQREDQPSLA
ncbi:diguanylate cyclase [Acidicapsa dinghuensis]|uniref:diguanylate cyclase n=1 Tax=Acidicapsa dinghuensis TaxID=2218256 RepID=A0ABW1EJN4_9BACT|nr:diguanylate cyclase [Acidicapsa dinghuensis]